MITGHTNAIDKYNKWFNKNYCNLRKYCKKYNIDDDLLNDVYINVHDRILRSGFTESYYTTYVKRSIRNLQINNGVKKSKKHFVEHDNKDYINTVDNKLQEIEDIEIDTLQYREDVITLSKKIFQYIMTEKKYCDEWQFVFRCYYLMQGRMTYSKLTKMTGINKNQCTKIIQTMKKDIRTNFLEWLNDTTRDN